MATHNVTHTELLDLMENSQLVPDDTYIVTDYSNSLQINTFAETESTIYDESIDSQYRSVTYVPETNTITYMKDIVNNIEGYFDWSQRIIGTCQNIYFGTGDNLVVMNSSDIIVDNAADGTIEGCNDIIVGEGSLVNLTSCSNIIVGKNSHTTLNGCVSLKIGKDNDIYLTDTTGSEIGDNNSSITLSGGRNIIGSNNYQIAVSGDSNIIGGNNKSVQIEGNVNAVDKSMYTLLNGAYNNIQKSTILNLNKSVGNTIDRSDEVEVRYTNNNVIETNKMILDNKQCFLSYIDYEGVRRVSNLASPVNMQADSYGNTLIVDEQKFYLSPSTRDNKHYVIVNGQWVNL